MAAVIGLLLVIIGILLSFTGIGLIVGVPIILVGGSIVVFAIIKGGIGAITSLFRSS